MRVSMIVMVSGVLCAAACGGGNDNESPRPAVAEGVYDATVVRDGASSDTIGVVDTGSDGISVWLMFGNDASVGFGGRMAEDGTVSSPGSLMVTDIGVDSHVDATFSETAGITTVTGSVVPTGTLLVGFEHPIAFTMERPLDADASGFSGAYRFTLEPSPSACACTSTLDLNVTIDASGSGLADATTERALDGTPIESLSGASVFLSPQGRLEVSFSYEAETGSFPGITKLIGKVDAAALPTTASGDTFFGFTPANRIGSWSAERLD